MRIPEVSAGHFSVPVPFSFSRIWPRSVSLLFTMLQTRGNTQIIRSKIGSFSNIWQLKFTSWGKDLLQSISKSAWEIIKSRNMARHQMKAHVSWRIPNATARTILSSNRIEFPVFSSKWLILKVSVRRRMSLTRGTANGKINGNKTGKTDRAMVQVFVFKVMFLFFLSSVPRVTSYPQPAESLLVGKS